MSSGIQEILYSILKNDLLCRPVFKNIRLRSLKLCLCVNERPKWIKKYLFKKLSRYVLTGRKSD